MSSFLTPSHSKGLKTLTKILAAIALVGLVAACTNSSGGDDGGGSGGGGGGDTGSNGNRQFTTDCGTLNKGEVQNPVSESDAVLVTVTRVATANSVVVQRANGGEQLVRLAGLSNTVSTFQNNRAISALEGLLGAALLFSSEEPDCSVTVQGGGAGISGSLFTRSSGQSFSELLLNQGLGVADSSSTCGHNQLSSCYGALAEDNTVETGGNVSNFLWKPVSERDGRLVVLLNPGRASVTANGETLTPSGPSNGRGTTVRGNRPGCAYGTNIRIEAFDSRGRVLLFPGDATSFTIDNGCNRVEF